MKKGPTTKALSRRGMRTLLNKACMELIDHPQTSKHVTVGNRYRMADAAEDVVKKLLNEQFKKQIQ